MSRSFWKGPYIDSVLYNQLLNGTKNIYTNSRSTTITELCIGKSIYIHNGMSYFKINITENMIGKKLGEFILSKKKVVFKKKKNKK
jgi:ribosomal protein S19